MSTRLVVLASVLALSFPLACGSNGSGTPGTSDDAGSTSGTDAIVGTWTLTTVEVDGITKPATDEGFTGSMTINADNTYTAQSTQTLNGTTTPYTASGTWSKSGSTYTFTGSNGDSTGTIAGDTLTRPGTFFGEKMTLGYTKA